jgi:exonuclease III
MFGSKEQKNEITSLILNDNIDILCIQETVVEQEYHTELLGFKDYIL